MKRLQHTDRKTNRAIRWTLVHAAGCVEPVCASKDTLGFWFEWAAIRGVSVPRSLRPKARTQGDER